MKEAAIQKKEAQQRAEEYVRQAIEAGLRDSDAGRIVSVEEVRTMFGLPK